MNNYQLFLQLHQQNNPFLLGNAWDVHSAKSYEAAGFKAIATSSAAVARSMGYEDGENIPFELLLQVVERISKHTTLPFSVDMERGFGKTAAAIVENLKQLHDLGVVGFNIEDSDHGDERKLQTAENFQQLLSAIAEQLAIMKIDMFINARVDPFLINMADPLAESIKRIKMYENAGATGIFVPFIYNSNDIKQVVQSTRLPVNVLCMKQLPSYEELSKFGVKRISMGSSVYNYQVRNLEKVVKGLQEQHSFESLF